MIRREHRTSKGNLDNALSLQRGRSTKYLLDSHQLMSNAISAKYWLLCSNINPYYGLGKQSIRTCYIDQDGEINQCQQT